MRKSGGFVRMKEAGPVVRWDTISRNMQESILTAGNNLSVDLARLVFSSIRRKLQYFNTS